MKTETELHHESMVDEFDEYEDYRYHQAEIEEAKGITEKIFELAKKSMDETFQKHPEECKRVIEIIEKYDCTRTHFSTLDIECLFFKLNEISDTLYDFYFLLVSARYNSARILLRKWIEIVVISIYFDTKGKNDAHRTQFLKVLQTENVGFSYKLGKLSDTSCNEDIKRLYKELSLYIHNEGKEGGQLLPVYLEKEFIDIYSKSNEIQLLVEKIILNNSKIQI